MAILHIVNRRAGLESCLAIADASDAILLIEDGVYAAGKPHPWPGAVFALRPDVEARGLLGRLSAGVQLATDADFVELVVAHKPIVTWR
jgi:tRNA 2-thiouridine synthesizing protein B